MFSSKRRGRGRTLAAPNNGRRLRVFAVHATLSRKDGQHWPTSRAQANTEAASLPPRRFRCVPWVGRNGWRWGMSSPQTQKPSLAPVGSLLPQLSPKTSSSAEAGTKKSHSYRPLDKEFQHKGFNYRQITREGNAAIYQQTCNGWRNPSVAYEVVRIRRREGFWINDRFVEPAEVYPKSEAWGTDGFTFTNKDAAFAKLRELAWAPTLTRQSWQGSANLGDG